MKKHLRTILLFLILGSILNIAVAWGLAIAINIYQVQDQYGSDLISVNSIENVYRTVRIRKIAGIKHLELYWSVFHGSSINGPSMPASRILSSWGSLTHSPPEQIWSTQTILVKYEALASGWPKTAFLCDLIVKRDSDLNNNDIGLRGGFLAPLPEWTIPSPLGWRTKNHARFIPYHPILSGVMVNTLFYALILWILFPGRYLLRSWRRIQKGLCRKCGYIVSVNAVHPKASPNCTECGTPLPRPRKTNLL